jgi:hypothetical protein
MKRLFKVLGKANTANWLLVTGFLIFLAGIGLFLYKQSYSMDLPINTSTFGDLGSFLSGTVGTLWSLASVLYFILALREQRKDIKGNDKSQRLQRFETTFFQLLQQHSNTTRDLTFGEDGKRLEGRKIFRYWKNYLDIIAKADIRMMVPNSSGGMTEYRNVTAKSNEEFEAFLEKNYFNEYYNIFEGSLNHYFRQLYHMFKYIHLSELIEDRERKFYTSLLRAQLSQDELYAIAVNCIIPDYGYPNFMFLLREYNLLKNFNFKVIPDGILWSYIHYKMDMAKDPFQEQS